MIIGKVVGTIVASRKESELTGLKFLAVSPIDLRTGEVTGGGVVAVDAVGAGVGETVLYASGSSARQTVVTQTGQSMQRSWRSSTRMRWVVMSCIRRVMRDDSHLESFGESALDEQRIARIVEQVVQRIGQDAPAVLSQRGQSVGGRGVHPTVDAAVAAAKRTFLDLQDISLSERARYIAALRQVTLNSLEEMARFAVEETGLGRVSDKIEKNRLVAEKTPGIESLQPVSQTGDHGLTLTEWAPYGVIGSITPCTNPTETILNNGIGMLASGNTVVFNTHPNAKRLSAWYIDLMNGAIESCGGPPRSSTVLRRRLWKRPAH